MEDANGRSVDGFQFVDRENGNIAKEEIQRINYISSRINEDNPEAVLSVYTKMIESNTFCTPVGLEYLRRLQAYLYKRKEIDDNRIPDIPVQVSYVDLHNRYDNRKDIEEDRPQRRRRVKTFKQQYKTSLLVNLVLILMIIAMFVIVLMSDTPNMINYENAITNRYASWEQELTERESKVRQKEAELGIE